MAIRSLVLSLAALGALLTGIAAAKAQEAPLPEGVEVLGRGPVHEGYAEPFTGSPRPGPAVGKQPPEPIEEVPPDVKPEEDDVIWLPGYWAWDEDREDFIWVSGFWRDPPPNRQWMPGYWSEVRGGWQWIPGFWQEVNRTEIQYLPPPPEVVDAGASTPAPSPDHVYVPGNWVFRETRYLWRPGYWVVCRPGWIWVPAHYVHTPWGCVFVDGYWDYELRERGVLFAPVYVQPRFRVARDFVYQPRFVLYTRALFGALFVRPNHGHYYFGDYFDDRYRRAGFVSWTEARTLRNAPDPLFSYYRWRHRDDNRWERDVRDLVTARYEDRAPRPPRTFVQQQQVIQNIKTTNVTNVTNVQNIVQNVTVMAPVNQVDKTVIKLREVPKERQQEARKSAEAFREVSQQRRKAEAQVRAQVAETPPREGKPAAGKPAAIQRPVTVELPKADQPRPAPRKPREGKAPPPPPQTPAAQDRTPPKPVDKPPKPEDRTPPKPVDKAPPKPADKAPPKPADKAPPKPADKVPPKPVDKPPKPEDKRPGKPEDKAPPKPEDRKPAKPEDRKPVKPEDRVPPRVEDRKPVPPKPPEDRKPAPPPFPEERKPVKPEDRKPPRVEDRKPTPPPPAPPEERKPPRVDDNKPPRPEDKPSKPEKKPKKDDDDRRPPPP